MGAGPGHRRVDFGTATRSSARNKLASDASAGARPEGTIGVERPGASDEPAGTPRK